MTCPHCAAGIASIFVWLVYGVEMATCYRFVTRKAQDENK